MNTKPNNVTKDLDKYFKNLLPGAKVYYPENKVIDLGNIPHNALSLYIGNFPYLALKPEASQLFKGFSESTLEELIDKKQKTYPEDVPILQEAIRLRLQNNKLKEKSENTKEKK